MIKHKDTINTERILSDMLREHAAAKTVMINTDPDDQEFRDAIDRMSELEMEIVDYQARTIAELAAKAKFTFQEWAEIPGGDAKLPNDLDMEDHALWALARDAEKLATPDPQAPTFYAELFARWEAKRRDYLAAEDDDERNARWAELQSLEKMLLTEPTSSAPDHALKIRATIWALTTGADEELPCAALKAVADVLAPPTANQLAA